MISRQAVKDIMFNRRGVRIYTHKGEKLKRYAEIDLDDFDAIPSAQPERKTGRWISCPQNASWLYVYKCSECGGYLQISDVDGIGITAKYCSYCGAKMEGGEQE